MTRRERPTDGCQRFYEVEAVRPPSRTQTPSLDHAIDVFNDGGGGKITFVHRHVRHGRVTREWRHPLSPHV